MAKRQDQTTENTDNQQANEQAPVYTGPLVKARVLVDCSYGKPNAVVALPKDQIDIGVASRQLDASIEAVAYAEAL